MRRVTSASYHRGALDEHPLRIRFLRYTMEGAGMEYGFLSSLDGISVEGPWPDDDKLTQTEAVDSLVAALINPRLNLCEAGESDPPAAIVLFACHCLTDKADEGDWEILARAPGQEGHGEALRLEERVHQERDQQQCPPTGVHERLRHVCYQYRNRRFVPEVVSQQRALGFHRHQHRGARPSGRQVRRWPIQLADGRLAARSGYCPRVMPSHRELLEPAWVGVDFSCRSGPAPSGRPTPGPAADAVKWPHAESVLPSGQRGKRFCSGTCHAYRKSHWVQS